MKKNNAKKLFLVIIPLLLVVVAYKYIYQDHRDIEAEKPEFALSSKALVSEFSENASVSEKKYLNRTIEISGSITEINNNNLVIDHHIFCQFQNAISPTVAKVEDIVTVKGRCIGYDDLLEEIKLDQCSVNSD